MILLELVAVLCLLVIESVEEVLLCSRKVVNRREYKNETEFFAPQKDAHSLFYEMVLLKSNAP